MMRKDSYQRLGLQGKQTCSSLTHDYLLVQWTLSSWNFLPIFNSLAVQVSGTIALVLDRNSASDLSVKQYHKPIQSEHSYRLKCVQSEPLFYTRNTRNCMVCHSGYLLLRNSISPSEPLHLHSRWSICLAWFLSRPSRSDPRRINTVDVLRHPDGS